MVMKLERPWESAEGTAKDTTGNWKKDQEQNAKDGWEKSRNKREQGRSGGWQRARDKVPDRVKMLKKREERRRAGGTLKAIPQLCLHQSCVV